MFGVLGSGNGREAELSRASRAIPSRGDGRLGSVLDRAAIEPDDGGRDEDEPGFGVLLGELPTCFASGALVTRPASFTRRGLVPLLPDTVWALTGCFGVDDCFVGVVSGTVSLSGCGFLACATARGPAQLGKMGHATLARTRLASTLTGRTFSVIFSCLAVSDTPNTICWTLLYTRRHVLKASDWGFDERSWR